MLEDQKEIKDKIPERKFWSKIKKAARSGGASLIYAALLMYYAFRRKETPTWAKAAILGAIAYFLSPIDFIPDLTPVLGYTDDLAVLLTGLITVGSHIDTDVRSKAKDKMAQWFDSEEIQNAIDAIDKKLAKL